MTNPLGVLVVPLALTLMVGGCASTDSGSAQSSPTATATHSSTPSAAPTETSGGRPAIGTLIVSPEGLGPMLIGQPMPAFAPGAEMVVWDETVCGFEDPVEDYGGWMLAYEERDSDGHFPFYPELGGSTPDSPIVRIVVGSTEIHTADGLGEGSTLSELEAIYGGHLQIHEPADGIFPVTVAGPTGQLIFWLDEGGDEVWAVEVREGHESPQFNYHVTYCA